MIGQTGMREMNLEQLEINSCPQKTPPKKTILFLQLSVDTFKKESNMNFT